MPFDPNNSDDEHEDNLQTNFAVEGMTCAACVARIEKVLNRLPGVSANINLATERARVWHPPSLSAEQLMAAVRKAGYGAHVGDPAPGPRSLRAELRLSRAAVIHIGR